MTRPPAVTPASIVNAMKAIAGVSPKARSSFARGRCVRGTYIPSDRADEVTMSRSFTRPSRVLARFSVDEALHGSEPGGLMLRGFSFRLGDAEHRSDIFTQSAPVHYARTLDQMLAFLLARRPGHDGKPDPEKIKAFSASNPETLRQADYVAKHPLPPGFAGTTYWAVHAFPATNSKGEAQFIKFKVAPVGSQLTLTGSKARTKPADALYDDLQRTVATGDIRFSLMALLGRSNDPTLDVTIRWPDEDRREALRLGTIVITAIEADETCDASFFDPANLAEGIGNPPDEIFAARRVAYAALRAKRR
ncbi:catalase [Bradyrhizobium sp. GCM10027634]|nr:MULTISPECIES: catalase [unclassified Bradyrhizobium]MDN4999274.1 catalase [Bradyrhizobium sp. WYCCWR 12677]QOZ43773.1 catalase [Bradyrhizobium sp. CCBAU 53340]